MKQLSLLALLALSSSVLAEPRPLDLDSLPLGPGVTRVNENGEVLLRIDRSAGEAAGGVLLFHLEKPGVQHDRYALLGEVRYRKMPAGSFLEMWNHFPLQKGGTEIEASYFSRTMGESGPMGKLSGDSDWRVFQLPFFADDGTGRRPLRLTLNVQFQGAGGIVEIRKLRFLDGLGGGGAAVPKAGGLGPVAAGFAAGAAVATGVAVICWRVAALRTRRELRRIHAADA